MDKLPEIFGFKAEVPLADGIGGEGVELFDPRADDEFRERARLVQRLRGGFGRLGGGGHRRGHVAEQVVHDVLRAGGAAHARLRHGSLFVLAHEPVFDLIIEGVQFVIPHEHGPEQLPKPLVLGRKGEAAGQTHTELALLLAQGGLVVDAVEAAQVLDEGAQVVGHAVSDLDAA